MPFLDESADRSLDEVTTHLRDLRIVEPDLYADIRDLTRQAWIAKNRPRDLLRRGARQSAAVIQRMRNRRLRRGR